MSNNQDTIVRGIITEALPNLMFRVTLETVDKEGEAEKVIAYLGGKMKYHRIRVMVGDSIEVLLDPYGGKARVVKRL